MAQAQLPGSGVVYTLPVLDRLEIRQDEETGGPGIIFGPAMIYGETATRIAYQERFLPGAFGELDGQDVIAHYMHDRNRPISRTGAGLLLFDSAEELRVEIRLTDTQDGRDAATNVRGGIFRGLSLEFMPVRSIRQGGVIVRQQARLRGVGVVDKPAYPGSVPEVRYANNQGRRRLWL